MVLLYDETKFSTMVGISQGRLLMLMLLIAALGFRTLCAPLAPSAICLCAFAILALARAGSRRNMFLYERLAAVVLAVCMVVAYTASAVLGTPTANVDISCLGFLFLYTLVHVFVRLSLGLARARRSRNSLLGAFGFADMVLSDEERPTVYSTLMEDMRQRLSDDDSDSDLGGRTVPGQSLFSGVDGEGEDSDE